MIGILTVMDPGLIFIQWWIKDWDSYSGGSMIGIHTVMDPGLGFIQWWIQD